MDPLVQYYRRQAGRGREDIGSIYSTPTLVQRGHGLGSVLAGLFRTLRPILWSGAKSIAKETPKALGREALHTGTNIIRKSSDTDHRQSENMGLTRHRI